MTRLRLFALLLFALALPAFAQERIPSHDSTVAVNADGSMDVTETIKVHAEGSDIRRGIYRDFPTHTATATEIAWWSISPRSRCCATATPNRGSPNAWRTAFA